MTDKKSTRKLYSQIRNSISESDKASFDERILTRFINSELYIKSDLLLIYVSVNSETDTTRIIEHALNNNKRVAVPVCIDKEMNFYEIKDISDLKVGKFGIPTVDAVINLKISDFSNALCVVPGICFDVYGNRIGYGGGYYDRFLSRNPVKTVGFTYERCICNQISSEPFDIPVNYVLTENKLRNSKMQGGFYI